ncbi:MAG: hypothetical protein HYX80_06255 [Chloroflexi bacterium]|nr:hypothetical protein [Chloroflexota bacterium]
MTGTTGTTITFVLPVGTSGLVGRVYEHSGCRTEVSRSLDGGGNVTLLRRPALFDESVSA